MKLIGTLILLFFIYTSFSFSFKITAPPSVPFKTNYTITKTSSFNVDGPLVSHNDTIAKIKNKNIPSPHSINNTKSAKNPILTNGNNKELVVQSLNFTTLYSDANLVPNPITSQFDETNLLCDLHCQKMAQIYGCYCDNSCKRYRDCCDLYLPECLKYFYN